MISTIQSTTSVSVQYNNEVKPSTNNKDSGYSTLNDLIANNKNVQDINTKQKDIANVNKERTQYSQKDISLFEEKLNTIVAEDDLSMKFSIDQETKKMILKVYDNETKEIVQQFPPEITLKIARIVARTLEQDNLTDAKVW